MLREARMKGLERMSRALAGCSLLVALLGAAIAPVQAQTPVVRFEVKRCLAIGEMLGSVDSGRG